MAFNETLTTIYIDHNKLSMRGVRELHKAISRNKGLTAWQIPMDDLARLFSKFSNESKAKELRTVVSEFELFMERNAEDARERAAT